MKNEFDSGKFDVTKKQATQMAVAICAGSTDDIKEYFAEKFGDAELADLPSVIRAQSRVTGQVAAIVHGMKANEQLRPIVEHVLQLFALDAAAAEDPDDD